MNEIWFRPLIWMDYRVAIIFLVIAPLSYFVDLGYFGQKRGNAEIIDYLLASCQFIDDHSIYFYSWLENWIFDSCDRTYIKTGLTLSDMEQLLAETGV